MDINNHKAVDAYMLQFPDEIKSTLQQLRKCIRSVVPEATEKICYQMPTFVWHGNLVHFAAYKNHIGFYPAPSAIVKFEKELSVYKTSKGAIQFPLHTPLPYELIEKIVRFRAEENIK